MPEPIARHQGGTLRAQSAPDPDILIAHREFDDHLAAVETMAKQELSRLGVLGVAYFGYLDFVRECWEKRRRCSGRSLDVEVATVLGKWKQLHFDEQVLLRLRDYVLAVQPR